MTVTVAAGSSVAASISGLGRLYSATLKDRGYRTGVVQAYTRALEHFLYWVGTQANHVSIDEPLIRRFVDKHLPVCECTGRRQRGKTTVRAALKRLAEILRSQGMPTVEHPREPDHIRHELEAFCSYATKVCGLAPSTLVSRRMWVSRFFIIIFQSATSRFRS
jgi:hypothetical protein